MFAGILPYVRQVNMKLGDLFVWCIVFIIFCVFQASLIGHMDALGLLRDGVDYIEFGAGKGTLACCVW